MHKICKSIKNTNIYIHTHSFIQPTFIVCILCPKNCSNSLDIPIEVTF